MAVKDFNGAVAIITGGASGIGLATARACYERGAQVVIADRDSQRFPEALEYIQQGRPMEPKRLLARPMDVTDVEQVKESMNQVLYSYGRIDLVVTCAGIGEGGLVGLFNEEKMRRIMDVNFMGTYNCVRAALPPMQMQQCGHFVFMSSVAGKLGVPLLSGYCATKWAVRGFASALRAELYGMNDINVTTVYPAWVDTPMIHQDGVTDRLMKVEALLTPEQVAEAIIQAVIEDQTELTLVPNEDIAFLLEVARNDPAKAEQLAGKAHLDRMRQLFEEMHPEYKQQEE